MQGAAALRELLRLYVPADGSLAARQLEGLLSVPVAPDRAPHSRCRAGRRRPRPQSRVTIDEAPFGGAGGILLAAVLDRFFAKYVSINAFTETVLRTPERGEVMRWPMRLGRAADPVATPLADARGRTGGPPRPRLPGALRGATPHRVRLLRRHAPAGGRARGPPAPRPQRPPGQDARAPGAGAVGHASRRATLAGLEPAPAGRPPRLLVHFFGLFGPDGPLPLHLTEYARDRRRNHARPDLPAFRRPVPPSRAVAVLSRLGRRPPDRQLRPPASRTASPPMPAR